MKGVFFINRNYKYPLTEYGKEVRTKLIKLDKSQEWLISEVVKKTNMFVDSSLMNKILTGRCNSERIMTAIDAILSDRENSVSE